MRFKNYLFIFLSSFFLGGCTAMQWHDYPVVENQYNEKTVLTDDVLSSFQYENLSVYEGGKSINLNLPSEGAGFVGKSNLYILTKGMPELISLSQYAGKYTVKSGNSDTAVKLKIKSSENKYFLGRFSEEYRFIIADLPSFSSTDKENIKAMGFLKYGSEYRKVVELEGVVISRGSINFPFKPTVNPDIDGKYKVEFYTTGYDRKFHPLNLAGNIISTPLTLVGDVIVVPLIFVLWATLSPH